tara:strand:+ start:1269 stop:1598 length:330 start_codon:yes stop_codon:yes gene_type:complete
MKCKNKKCKNERAPGRAVCYTCKNLLYRYGVTGPERAKILREQNNSCRICSRKIKFTGKNDGIASLDHCHKTGRVRGVLCGKCNTWIGYYENNKIDLEIVKNYIGGEDE